MQNFDSIMSSSLAQRQSNGGSWYDMTIKSEPSDTSNSYGQQYPSHHHHHLQQQDTPMSHSSPTSPQSVDSMDSMSGRSQYYDVKPTNGLIHGYNPLGFNPLTPPGYAGMFVPTQQQLARQTTPNRSYAKQDSGYVSSTLTPTHTPPMDVTPPKSPKEAAETPEKDDDHGSDCEESYDGSEDEDGIRKPKINSHGKVKKFKCKQCDFIAVTKLNFWEHTRNHIKPEKMLTCPKCPFVTEYKHHLEYHLRNHQRSKPFQCPKCTYSCVNKSMLNSHMKSHSNVFQYRCADCNYATKYCHSLKLHLRKYSHKPDVVLNLDGTPNPLPIIDVYGTRRGPKTKSQKTQNVKQETQPNQPAQNPQSHQSIPNQSAFTPPNAQPTNLSRTLLPHQLLPNPLAHMFKSAASNNLSLFPYLNLNFQMFADQQAAMAQLSPNFHQQFSSSLTDKLTSEDSTEPPSKCSSISTSPTTAPTTTLSEELLKQITAAAADSSNLKSSETDSEPAPAPEEPPTPQTPSTSCTSHPTATISGAGGSTGKNRRKGRAFKLERLSEFTKALETAPSPMDQSDDEHSNGFERHQQQQQQQQQPQQQPQQQQQPTMVDCSVQTTPVASPPPPPAAVRTFECKYCDISFRDDVLYTIHMGYHGYDEVFKCNMCGERSEDRIGFFLHIARKAH
ncbi:protein hunchback [Ochlerotatus camptorhynchus]|uniref:protein hunchback n=1 Tax=Ochlerotatus camptorhynchus TaxID=644619 RepID=UPI0031DCCEAB